MAPATPWVQVESDTFVVKSSIGENAAVRVLRELEAFHELIGKTVAFRKVELPELPIEVLIIGNEAQYNELSPEYNGKKVKVSGYYQRGQDRDFIVLYGNANGNRTHVVYHELTHYFLSRSLQARPTWLNEGLAEYFATADVTDDSIYLGALPADRLNLLKASRMLPLKELFAVDDQSPYYNETDQANIFYSQSWAFVHFLMHGPYQNDFKRYLAALATQEANLTDYLAKDLTTIEQEFEFYLRNRIRTMARERVKTHPEAWEMTRQPVTEADVELAITEIFLSAGKFDQARKHLEKVTEVDDEFPRAAYYRGILARIKGEGDPREFFIDALMDLNLGPRAAVNLVQLHELQIPGARIALEQAAAKQTHMADVYWALSEIYMDDARRAQETLRLNQHKSVPVTLPSFPVAPDEPEPQWTGYASGSGDHFQYELLSGSGTGPAIQNAGPPFFPPELLSEGKSGRVVLDVQVEEDGKVGGVWLISSSPEIFSGLAISAIRDWRFEAVPAKIRIDFQFIP
jgi:TonB family protein